MAYPQGFTYVSGPKFIREFNLASACTVVAFQPVVTDSTGSIIESLATMAWLTGFILHRAVDSVPAGKCLVMIPGERTIWASICTAGATAANLASRNTGFHVKSGNSFYFDASAHSSYASNLYTIVPREDGSTIDSTDSSIWVQVNQAALVPFNPSGTVAL